MRALCLTATGGPDHLALLDIPSPGPLAPDEVRIGVRAVALNHLDIWVADGLPAVPIPTFPHVIGSDAAGEILEIGSTVTDLSVGDRVVINPGVSCRRCEACMAGETVFCRSFSLLGEHVSGVAAAELVLPRTNVAAITGGWSWAEAAAFPLSTLTAWRMLTTRARLGPGEVVLIWGIGGGVALQALQIARHLGARVAVTSSSDAKLECAAAYGAELLLRHDLDDVATRVKQHFGHGADVVVDSVGKPTWQRSLKALRPGGRLVTCGATAGPEVEIDLRRLFWFQWSLLGSTMGTPAEFAAVVALGNEGRLRPEIDSIFPLADGAMAYRRMAAGQQLGKLVLEMDR